MCHLTDARVLLYWICFPLQGDSEVEAKTFVFYLGTLRDEPSQRRNRLHWRKGGSALDEAHRYVVDGGHIGRGLE